MVEISLIGASVLALVIIAIPTFKDIWYSYDVPGGAEGRRLRGHGDRLPVVVQVRLPERDRPDDRPDGQDRQRAVLGRERARDPGGPPGADQPADGGRHPQLLDPQARGQGGHDAEPREPPLGPGRQAGVFLGAVRRVLRRVPCGHALPGDRARAEGIQRLAERADGAGPQGRGRGGGRREARRRSSPSYRTFTPQRGRLLGRSSTPSPLESWRAQQQPPARRGPRADRQGPPALQRQDLRHLPHDPRRRLHRRGRAGADPRRRPLDDRRRASSRTTATSSTAGSTPRTR